MGEASNLVHSRGHSVENEELTRACAAIDLVCRLGALDRFKTHDTARTDGSCVLLGVGEQKEFFETSEPTSIARVRSSVT